MVTVELEYQNVDVTNNKQSIIIHNIHRIFNAVAQSNINIQRRAMRFNGRRRKLVRLQRKR